MDPSSFAMRSGSNLSLQTIWSTGSPLCGLKPLWYSWSVEENGSATGFLNATAGPSATFLADSFHSGEVGVRVRSGVALNCGGVESVVEQATRANISIVLPLWLSVIELGPNPLPAGSAATLRGTVGDGLPPYSVDVQWGDGTRSSVSLGLDGSFSLAHSFSAGEYAPTLIARDSAGDQAHGSVDEALSVGEALAVAIEASSYVAEVGREVDFTGVVQGLTPGMVLFYDCSNASIGSAPSRAVPSSATEFSCTFAAPGSAGVLFAAYPSGPGGPSASVVLYLPVVASPHVSVTPSGPVGESGASELLEVGLSGGAFPVVLTWNFTGNRSGESETVWSDGIGVIDLPLGSPGEYPVGVVASDALGGFDANGTATVVVDPPLRAAADVTSSARSYGALAAVSGDALAGCPPFAWWVVPQFAPSNSSTGNGTLEAVGGFAWNGSYAREGNLSIEAGVTDACGATWETGLVTPLVPCLWVTATAGQGPAAPNESLAVNLSIGGGLAPFRLEIHSSANESWNRTALADGVSEWIFPTRANGTVALLFSLTDGLGRTAWSNLSVVLVPPPGGSVPPPTTIPPPGPVAGPLGNSSNPSLIDPTWLLAGVLIPVGAATAFVLVRRWRSRGEHPASPGPDPVATLRRIIEPADGAERFTVELLAEEAGIPLTVVRSTIDRLVSEGTVHSESGADGEEVLSWSVQRGP